MKIRTAWQRDGPQIKLKTGRETPNYYMKQNCLG
jgi:hypothetical protein